MTSTRIHGAARAGLLVPLVIFALPATAEVSANAGDDDITIFFGISKTFSLLD